MSSIAKVLKDVDSVVEKAAEVVGVKNVDGDIAKVEEVVVEGEVVLEKVAEAEAEAVTEAEAAVEVVVVATKTQGLLSKLFPCLQPKAA